MAAFAVGIFVASFFVNITGPRFGFGGRGHGFHKMQQLQMENEDLRNENLRLKNELENKNFQSGDFHLMHDHDFESRGPEFPVEAPAPPPPPRILRSRR